MKASAPPTAPPTMTLVCVFFEAEETDVGEAEGKGKITEEGKGDVVGSFPGTSTLQST